LLTVNRRASANEDETVIPRRVAARRSVFFMVEILLAILTIITIAAAVPEVGKERDANSDRGGEVRVGKDFSGGSPSAKQ
jgi:hypothetical protein